MTKKLYYVATMETESFSWVALGDSMDNAGKALLKKWNEQKAKAKEYGCEMKGFESWSELNEYYGITFWAFHLNTAEMM